MSKQWIITHLDEVIELLAFGSALALILSFSACIALNSIQLRLKKLEGQSTDTTT